MFEESPIAFARDAHVYEVEMASLGAVFAVRFE